MDPATRNTPFPAHGRNKRVNPRSAGLAELSHLQRAPRSLRFKLAGYDHLLCGQGKSHSSLCACALGCVYVRCKSLLSGPTSACIAAQLHSSSQARKNIRNLIQQDGRTPTPWRQLNTDDTLTRVEQRTKHFHTYSNSILFVNRGLWGMSRLRSHIAFRRKCIISKHSKGLWGITTRRSNTEHRNPANARRQVDNLKTRKPVNT